jgi:lipoprotein-anchoring transpeptidase ErfK/SrfK
VRGVSGFGALGRTAHRRDDARQVGRPVMLMRAIGCCAIVGLLAAGCTAGHAAATGRHSLHSRSATGLGLTISPASGSTNVSPGDGITVTATHGRLTGVSVQGGGDPVAGSMNSSASIWHSAWTLGVSSRYTVTATAQARDGKRITQTSTFTTLTPSSTFATEIYEAQGATYGVGMPIMLTFSQPIVNKAAVERALQIQTSKPVVGAWYWDGSQKVDFRPQSYWPPDTTVSFTGHLDGVEGAPGVYGSHTLTQSFRIGDSMIVVASTATHYMDLYRNGRLFARWPISTGRPALPTPDGTYVTIDKGNPVLMVGPGYSEDVYWSVRFTFSGDYLHAAPWSVADQGVLNVSHGCVNMPPADAEEYYKMEVPGDPVTITGSPAAGTWDDGWTEWFLSWPQYVKGSALGEAVEAGPQGSVFVNPSSLPASTAAAPLSTSASGNWHAS